MLLLLQEQRAGEETSHFLFRSAKFHTGSGNAGTSAGDSGNPDCGAGRAAASAVTGWSGGQAGAQEADQRSGRHSGSRSQVGGSMLTQYALGIIACLHGHQMMSIEVSVGALWCLVRTRQVDSQGLHNTLHWSMLGCTGLKYWSRLRYTLMGKVSSTHSSMLRNCLR